MNEARAFFQKTFQSVPVRIVQAPGRLELLGNHTDYNEGLVMSIAVNRYVHIAALPRRDGRIKLVSSAFPGAEEFPIDRIEKNPDAPWTSYPKGVLRHLARRGVRFGGFNAAIWSSIPLGAGLSSSAALEVATAMTVRALYPYQLKPLGVTVPPLHREQVAPPMKSKEKMMLARVCREAESEFVGVHCGLLDQISSLFGKAGQALQIDCKYHTVEHHPMVPGVVLVVCDSGVKHELASGQYNELRRQCEAAARALGVQSLRSIDPKQLETGKPKLTEREHQCAYHIVGENQRVVFGERALRGGDIEQFGQYLFQSHESSRRYFKNSAPELDLLVELARKQHSCLGARLTGGGFGGATINLVLHTEVPAFSEAVAKAYQKETGRKIAPWVCQVVDGAG